MIRKKILYVHITNISTSPAICCYTTLWKSKSTNVTDFDSTSTECWRIPVNTLRTWFNILTVVRQTVSRPLTLTDWLTFWSCHRRQLESTVEPYSVEHCCNMAIFPPWLSSHRLRSFYAILRNFVCCTHIEVKSLVRYFCDRLHKISH